jgi:hypothetical protein
MIKWENKVGKDSKDSLQNTLAFNGGVKLLLALAFASNVGGNFKTSFNPSSLVNSLLLSSYV